MAYNFKQESSAARPYVLLIILLALSLVSVTAYAREGEGGVLHGVQSGFSAAFAPLKALSGGISAAEDSAATASENASADENTLSALRSQNEELRSTIAELEEYRQEATRLEGLLNLKNSYSLDGVTGHVLSRSTDAWNLVMTIDRGSNDGVRAGLPVMGNSGLVGQVISTSLYTSEVRLLADPQSGVAVMIQSTRAEGVLKGSLDGLLYLENLDDDAAVQTGDVIITSGLGGGYFRGILVGTVVRVEGSQGSTNRKIVVDPNDSTSPLAEVMVVTAMNSEGAAATGTTSTSTSSSTTSSTTSSATASSSTTSSTTSDTTSSGTATSFYATGSY